MASLRHLQPTLTKLGDAGDSLAPGLSMLASFPFPKEAANIVRGDYANALFHMDIDLNKVIKSPGEVLPNVINLCSATPLAPACDALSPALKATVCAVAPQRGRRPPVPARQRGLQRDPDPAARPGPGQELGRSRLVRQQPADSAVSSASGEVAAMTHGARVRLIAFVVLSAVGIVYVASSFLGLTDRLLGRGLTIKATLPNSGGLFTGSEVTYRGVKVGKVSGDGRHPQGTAASGSPSRTGPRSRSTPRCTCTTSRRSASSTSTSSRPTTSRRTPRPGTSSTATRPACR